jgi:hypothetical protein
MKPLLKRPNNEIDLTRNVEGEICNKDNFPTFSKALEERVSFLKEFLHQTPDKKESEKQLSQAGELLYGYLAMRKVSNRLKPSDLEENS